jgi:hypothetical protein
MAEILSDNRGENTEDEVGNGDLPSFGIQLSTGEPGNLHTQNDELHPWQRENVVERKGLVDVRCTIKDIVHGSYSAGSDDPCSLIVVQFRFDRDGNSRRIKEARIWLTFSAIEKGNPDPEVAKAFPDRTFTVEPKTQIESSTIAGGANIGFNVLGAEVGGEFRREKTVDREATDATLVRGSIDTVGRNFGRPNAVSWTLLENKTDKTGVPASMQCAILLRREDDSKFQAHFKMKIVADTRTTVQSIFKSNPKDDPVLFDPDIRPTNKLRVYDEKTVGDLGSLNLEQLGDITFSTIWTQGVKKK